jgi:endonuclease YncB( thermonuclease family)
MERVAALLLILLTAVPVVARADVSGTVIVVRGDVIEVGNVRLRLAGIAAPVPTETCFAGEREWPCGAHAKKSLAEWIGDRSVSCKERGQDRSGRITATCSVDDQDLGAWMISQGWARAGHLYSYDYTRAEYYAKAARRGIWADE